METALVGKRLDAARRSELAADKRDAKIASAPHRDKRKWATRRILAAVAMLAGCVVWNASLHTPTGPAVGGSFDRLAASPVVEWSTLRVATFNIHGCKGLDGRRDLPRVADCLRGFHVAGLNEVHRVLWRGSEDQAAQIAGQLGVDSLFAPADSLWYGARQSGNALLTTLPLRSWYRIPLPRDYDRSCRNLVLACVEHCGRPIHLLATHVVRRDDRERQAQLRAVIATFLCLAEPAILLGDLNSEADDPQVRELLAVPGIEDPLARRLGQSPPGRIDWILARGLRSVDAGTSDRGASDHPLVWAEFEIPISEKPRAP